MPPNAVNALPPPKSKESTIPCPWCKGMVVVDLDARANGTGHEGQMRVAITGTVRPHACPYRLPTVL